MKVKKVITLEELETLYAKKVSDESGKIVTTTQPMELTPGWFSYCKRHWGVWHKQEEARRQQLAYLDLIETHEIDYYKNTKAIVPF
jgi:hypothetical protein